MAGYEATSAAAAIIIIIIIIIINKGKLRQLRLCKFKHKKNLSLLSGRGGP
jgi:hypothetical protein